MMEYWLGDTVDRSYEYGYLLSAEDRDRFRAACEELAGIYESRLVTVEHLYCKDVNPPFPWERIRDCFVPMSEAGLCVLAGAKSLRYSGFALRGEAQAQAGVASLLELERNEEPVWLRVRRIGALIWFERSGDRKQWEPAIPGPMRVWSSRPTQVEVTSWGLKPVNQASTKSLVVPVLPARPEPRTEACLPVPLRTTSCSSRVMT